MTLPNFTDQKIQDTYQRVVQKDENGQLFDGTGSGTAGPELKLDAGTANNSISSGDIGPVRFDTDIYLTLSGTGAEGWVIYNEDSE